MEPREYRALRAVEDEHWWFCSLHEMVVRDVRDAFPKRRPRVLDAGCGTGGLLARLSDLADVSGFDGSEAAVELCRARGLTDVWRDDINAPSLEPESYDAIVCIDVLYHRDVRDDVAALHRLAAALRPGGRLFLHLPAYEWLRGSHDRHVHTRKRYRLNETRLLMREAGLTVRHASYRVGLLLPAIAIVRLASRGASSSSDVRPVPTFLNKPLLVLNRLDNAVSRRIGLPFGSSIYLIGSKTSDLIARSV